MSDNAGSGGGGRYDSTSISSSSFISSIGSNTSWSYKKDQVFKFMKEKRNEFMTNDSTIPGTSKGIPDPDNDHAGYDLSSVDREKALRRIITNNSDVVSIPLPNKPFEGENLTLFPSYSREADNGHYKVDVRGMLWLPPVMNKKTRFFQTVASKLAGISTNGTASPGDSGPTSFELNQLRKMEREDDGYGDDDSTYTPSRRTTSSSVNSLSSDEVNFKARFDSLSVRAAPDRQLTIHVGFENVNQPAIVKEVTTFSSGRFLTRIDTPTAPSFIHVEASNEVFSTIEPIIIKKNEPNDSKISVITDIDDTIKHTGVTGDKRKILRNILVSNYEDIAIEGVVDWFSRLEKEGVKFHYVSNSPWELYSVIHEYMKHSKLPEGSIHLKLYSGIIDGLLSPSSEKKRRTLYNIVKDFPDRKFILVGDSGEKDLEAYIELAQQYPKQILAIYIRDLTISDEKTFQIMNSNGFTDERERRLRVNRIEQGRERVEEREKDLIDLEDVKQPEVASLPSSQLSVPSLPPTLPPRLPPRPRQNKVPRKPPPVPQKPQNLRPKNAEGTLESIPSLTPTPAALTRSVTPTVTPTPPLSRSVTPPVPRTVTPPPLRPNPYALNVSNSAPNISESSDRPPLPPRKVATTSTTSTTSDPYMLSSQQDDYGEFILDKKLEQWKGRVRRIRSELPSGIKLRMWRTGKDLQEESIMLVREKR